MTNTDYRIDDYIAKLPKWQQDICRSLRKIIHNADAEIEETIKRTTWPYFTLKGNVCALQATKDHVNLIIYDPIADDPEDVINQGKNNLTARAVQIYKNSIINELAIQKLLRQVIANNRVGGWRSIVKSSKLID